MLYIKSTKGRNSSTQKVYKRTLEKKKKKKKILKERTLKPKDALNLNNRHMLF